MRFEALSALSLLFLLIMASRSPSDAAPMNCTDTSRLCTSFLAFRPSPGQTLAVIQSMFDVLAGDVTVESPGAGIGGYVFVRKNCSCAAPAAVYLTNTTFTVPSSRGLVGEIVSDAYAGLAYLSNDTAVDRRPARLGAVVSLRLLCGCSSGLWNYLVSYVMEDGDSVESLASRFGVSMDSIERVNGISDPNNITSGSLYYIPLDSGL